MVPHVHLLTCATAFLALGGCSEPREPPPVRQSAEATKGAPATQGVRESQMMVDGRGLIVSDGAGSRTIAFDGPVAAAVAAARQVYGEPENVESLEECGAGPLKVSRFAGLTLAAQDGKFVGWWLDGRAKPPLSKTAAGIGIGSTRAELDAAYSLEEFHSSLGDEFTAGGMAGLISGEGKSGRITHLWAGATCIMR